MDLERIAIRRADTSYATYQQERVAHWDAVAAWLDTHKPWSGAYHRRLAQIYRHLVPPGLRVLEAGCGQGHLLAALQPAEGVGVDVSPQMIARARRNHPALRFLVADVHDFDLDETFDVIILSDLVNDLWDVQTAFQRLLPLCSPRTRLILNVHSRLWETPLRLAQKAGLAKLALQQNWLTVEDITGLLNLADFEVIRSGREILLPLPIPLLAGLANRYLVKLSPFKHGALTNVVVARPLPGPMPCREAPLVSVVIPARNEAGHVRELIARIPEMGRGTEIIFVEGHSTDDTYAIIEQGMAEHPERRCCLFRQTGTGKGDAVRLGFEKAKGDLLMILDADLAVPPEDLPRFYDALLSGKADLVNGVRLVYPMEDRAMRFANLVGNKGFSLALSWLLGQPVKDTLCGTKALWKDDYDLIRANRSYFGNFDPFGDFDLLFGAAKLNRKIIDMPIRYRERTYGATNIRRWRHGVLLLRMVLFAARRIKFV